MSPTEKKVDVHLRLDATLYQTLTKMADAERRSFNAQVNIMLAAALKKSK